MPEELPRGRARMKVRKWWQILGYLPLTSPTGPGGLHFVDSGADDLVCGKCGAVLAFGMSPAQLPSAALLCSHCHSWNIAQSP